VFKHIRLWLACLWHAASLRSLSQHSPLHVLAAEIESKTRRMVEIREMTLQCHEVIRHESKEVSKIRRVLDDPVCPEHLRERLRRRCDDLTETIRQCEERSNSLQWHYQQMRSFVTSLHCHLREMAADAKAAGVTREIENLANLEGDRLLCYIEARDRQRELAARRPEGVRQRTLADFEPLPTVVDESPTVEPPVVGGSILNGEGGFTIDPNAEIRPWATDLEQELGIRLNLLSDDGNPPEATEVIEDAVGEILEEGVAQEPPNDLDFLLN
jgi:hypothetical protein